MKSSAFPLFHLHMYWTSPRRPRRPESGAGESSGSSGLRSQQQRLAGATTCLTGITLVIPCLGSQERARAETSFPFIFSCFLLPTGWRNGAPQSCRAQGHSSLTLHESIAVTPHCMMLCSCFHDHILCSSIPWGCAVPSLLCLLPSESPLLVHHELLVILVGWGAVPAFQCIRSECSSQLPQPSAWYLWDSLLATGSSLPPTTAFQKLPWLPLALRRADSDIWLPSSVNLTWPDPLEKRNMKAISTRACL